MPAADLGRAICALAGTVVVAALAAGCSQGGPAGRPATNLVLVTIDTLRADHLGIYGYLRDTSPHLDALARDGTWFTRVYSLSATTGAAHASLFTSLPPAEHRVYANRQRFPDDKPTLMSALRERGYFTAGFVSSIVVGRQSGLQDHFDHFDDELPVVDPALTTRYKRPARDTVEAVKGVLDRRPTDRPFFLWIHLIDPHGPYEAPVEPNRFVGDAIYGRIGKRLPLGTSDWERGRIPLYQILDGSQDADFYVARYDAEIRYADAALGDLFADLRRRGLDAGTLIAVTADHGETLVEEGHHRYFAHGAVTYEETVRIPLIIREPRGERRLGRLARDVPFSSLDIAPTLLALLGVDAPPAFRGRSRLVAAPDPDVTLFSAGSYGSRKLEHEIGTQFTLRRGPWRLVVNLPDGEEELYDHRSDPVEARNVVADGGAELHELRRELNAILVQRPTDGEPRRVSESDAASLKALGYAE